MYSLLQAGPTKELPPGALKALAGVSKKQKLAFQRMTQSAPFCISRSKMLIPRPALGGRLIWSVRKAGCSPQQPRCKPVWSTRHAALTFPQGHFQAHL